MFAYMAVVDVLVLCFAAAYLIQQALWARAEATWQLWSAQFVAVLALLVLFHWKFGMFTPSLREKGQGADSVLIILYCCMLLGMLCHHLYVWLVAGRKQAFKWPEFFSTFLIAPVVFLRVPNSTALGSLWRRDLHGQS